LHLNITVSGKSISNKFLLLFIPLSLAAFTHLWNPIGFPHPDFDEGIYMSRALHVLAGQGPQITGFFSLYDHPYFGQLFLAGALSLVGYPNSLNPLIGNVHSIETLFMVPRVVMGLLAIVDTALIYGITQRRYNNTVALIASILFAVLPFSLLLRTIWLESIQLPFILSSILCAVSLKSVSSERKNILILFSGVLLGIAIFTKIPAVTIIPALAYLVFTNSNRNLKNVSLWLLPVILIPIIWPAYSIYLGEFFSWMHGIYGQSHREGITLLSSLNDFFKIDPIMALLGIAGIIYAALKRDFFILLWTIPLLIFLSLTAGTSYYLLLPIFPAFCIGAARLIELSKKIPRIKMHQVPPFLIIAILGIFALITSTALITTSSNTSYFNAAAFLTKYLQGISKINANNDKITVISDPFFLWMPQYVFHLKHEYVPFYMLVSINTDKVAYVIDKNFLDGLPANEIFKKFYDFYGEKEQQIFKIGDPANYGISVELSERTSDSRLLNSTANLVDMNHTWSPINGATVSQDGVLQIRTNSNNTDKVYSGAVLHTQIGLKEKPLLLHLKYGTKSISGNASFIAEITEDKNASKTESDYLFNTLYSEITEPYEGPVAPWQDFEVTRNEEMMKGEDGGRILWNAHLNYTDSNLTGVTSIFPRLGTIGYSGNPEVVPIQVRLYIVAQGIGDHELTINEFNLR
jgi:Dolichyl-phosphate-mannose-protein mannosyltransferase